MTIPLRTATAAHDAWRTNLIMQAWLYLTTNGNGPLPTHDIAKALDYDKRTVAMVLRLRTDLFIIEVRASQDSNVKRGDCLYARINPDAIKPPPPPEHPKLLRDSTMETKRIASSSSRKSSRFAADG